MTMKIGYARVSTTDQNLDMQLDELKKAGCKKIFTDKVSGAKEEREGLNNALNYAREGDCLVVYKLDRLARSLKQLVELINKLATQQISFQSLNENINTTSPTGKLVFHIFASIAEFERDIIRDRTKAGLKAARTRGRLGGRPKALNEDQIKMLKSLHQDKSNSINEICKMFNIKKPTLYKYLSQSTRS